MGSYIPSTAAERQAMLEAIGCRSMDDLFVQVPPEMKVDRLDLPAGKSELEVRRVLEGMAGKNRVFSSVFRGAGAYRHYIPAIVKSVTSKEEFITAYTPYQAEISQGVLQSIFEYQTMICELTGTVACVYLQQPNYFGRIESAEAAVRAAHAAGAKCIMGVNPIAMAVLRTPGECGADIAVGEGQSLGLPLSFGGPYLGFMACTKALTRKLPGRIVGQTADHDGRRAYVLTLQAREQHIRREKASSNVCSNQALCAMTASVYLAAMGPYGLRRAADSCMAHARYAAERICSVPGFDMVYPGPYFHEFVTTCPVKPEKLTAGLEARGILGGLPIEQGILWCATEMNTKDEIDALEAAIREVC